MNKKPRFNTREYQENLYLINNINDVFIKNRIEFNLRWFISHSINAKILYYIFSILTIVSPIISGIFLISPLDEVVKNIVSAIVLGISTASASLLNLFDFKTKWNLYRNQSEEIKRLLVEYFSILSLGDNKISEVELLKSIENSIKITDKKWNEFQSEN